MSSGKNVFLFWIWHPSQIFRNYVSSHCQIMSDYSCSGTEKTCPTVSHHLSSTGANLNHEKKDWVLCLWVCRSRKKWIYIFRSHFFCPLDARCSLYTWREKGDEFELDELKPQYANTISNLCGPDAVLYTASKKPGVRAQLTSDTFLQ